MLLASGCASLCQKQAPRYHGGSALLQILQVFESVRKGVALKATDRCGETIGQESVEGRADTDGRAAGPHAEQQRLGPWRRPPRVLSGCDALGLAFPLLIVFFAHSLAISSWSYAFFPTPSLACPPSSRPHPPAPAPSLACLPAPSLYKRVMASFLVTFPTASRIAQVQRIARIKCSAPELSCPPAALTHGLEF